MIDLSILPAKLPPIHTQQGPVAIERLHSHHADTLSKAGASSANSVVPWLGKVLCPCSQRAAQQSIKQLEESRLSGFGIYYIMVFEEQCLGMGFLNYIHPIHNVANLGYWLVEEARGQGLAKAFCESLIRLAFSQMNLARLELLIEPENGDSITLAKRLGAKKEALCSKRIFGKDALLFSIT